MLFIALYFTSGGTIIKGTAIFLATVTDVLPNIFFLNLLPCPLLPITKISTSWSLENSAIKSDESPISEKHST